jgi:sugar/nucleoside kinase (ribokinase family)
LTPAAPRPVLCVGILVADIFVPPLERLPDAGELVATEDFLIQPGGCAANTAIALAKLGVPAGVCGRVGDDLFAEIVLRDLHRHAVDTRAVSAVEGCGTSKSVIVPVRGEDRRFIHTFGANAALTAADIPAELLDSASVLYVGGYLVLPGLLQSELAGRLREARTHGLHVILDVAVPSERPDLSLDAVRELLPLADYFIPNDDEARALTGERDPAVQAKAFLDCGARTVVIKLGGRGVHVQTAETAFDMPAPPVEVVEPSGAGDAFAAGLVVGILEHWPLERSIRFASVAGASACTALGCWAGVFSRREADEFVASHDLPALRV